MPTVTSMSATVETASPSATHDSVSPTVAIAELGRFLRLTTDLTAQDEQGAMPMFSAYVDAAWHRLLENPLEYEPFCVEHAGVPVRHVELTGTGPIGWVAAYETAYGPLPEVWFADASGVVDGGLLAEYRSTGTVVTSWDCSPAPGDSDPHDGDTAEPRPTHTDTRPQELPDPGWGGR